MSIFQIKHLLSVVFSEFWSKLFYSINWFFFMWNNRNFDHRYLDMVIYKKLGDIGRCIDKYSYSKNKKRYVRMIGIARWYLDRLIRGDACDTLYNKVYEKYGNSDMKFGEGVYDEELKQKVYPAEIIYTKCKTEAENNHARRLMSIIHTIEIQRYKDYRDRYYRIMKRYEEEWWN